MQESSSKASYLGVMTIAFGIKRYRSQAIRLAQSIKLHNPSLMLACVTDTMSDLRLAKYFDILIPFRPELGMALEQKLHFDEYTPFERTLVIDSDCLVVGSLQKTIAATEGQDFMVLGHKITTGWWYMDVPKVMAKYRLDYIPIFNGGFYFFARNPRSQWLFNKARQIGRIHKRLHIYDLGSWFNEEVFYALALAAAKVEPNQSLEFEGGMATPDHFKDPFRIDVLQGYCYFSREGQVYSPSVVHFFGSYTRSYQYWRETRKLEAHFSGDRFKLAFNTALIRCTNAFYRGFVRLYLFISPLRGRSVSFQDGMPLLPIDNFFTSLTKKIFNR